MQHILILARLFRRKSRAIVIARSLSSCKNFNIAHNAECIKGIIIKLGIRAHHNRMQLHDKGLNSESYSFGVMPPFNLFLSRMMTPDRRALVLHAVLLIYFLINFLKYF